MAKTVAPLLSFDAAGTVAKTQVYSRWKGRRYVRRWTTPANPQSSEQMLTRNAFSFLNAVYKLAPPLVTDSWAAYAQNLVMTARNGWIKNNLPTLRGTANLNGMVMSAGALGGLPPTAISVTPGAGQLTVDITAPTTLPTGWTIASAVAAVIPDQDPDTGVLTTITADEDVTAPYSIVLTGLTAAQLYQAFAWLTWTRPDGKTAYSASIRTTGTPT